MELIALIAILLAGGGLAWWSQRINENLPRMIALLVVLVDLAYLLSLIVAISPEQFSLVPVASDGASWLLYYNSPWIPRFGISLQFAMDGLSLLMVALTIFLGFVAIISSWDEIDFRPGFFQFNILWTLAGVVGVFVSLDLFLFFFFFGLPRRYRNSPVL